MTKRIQSILYILLSIVFLLTACSTTTVSDNTAYGVFAPETEMIITSSKTQVSKFVTKNKDFVTSYNMDECYNITPDFIADNFDFAIFKYNQCAESFIMYDKDIYSIGTCFGGFGITSMALADLNMDNQYELYYTFSWGSGLHRSQIGYFDPVDKEITIFDDSFPISDLMLTVNKSGDLCVNTAVIDADSFVNFSIKAQDLIGTIIFDEDKITLNIDEH